MSGQFYIHIETTQLICSANQLAGFYMIVILLWYDSNIDDFFNMHERVNLLLDC